MTQLLTVPAAVCIALALGSCGMASQPSGSAESADPAVSTAMTGSAASGGSNYAEAAHWVCRPEAETVCTTGLSATVENANGSSAAQPFTPAADPPIDCFYVYPTVSEEKTYYSDLADSPEVQAVTRAQVGRLSSRCRVFAPIYRQVTAYGLTHPSSAPAAEPDFAMLDVQAAWNFYLQNDNKGRGVVLIGHSQGTILLQNLLAGSIDGTARQALLVSAFLPGDPSLGVPAGRVVGGTFAHIPTCSDAAQTGCVYVWGSYLPSDTAEAAVFGRARTDGLVSACVNPAAPGGGAGALKFYHANSKSPWWSELLGQFSGACQMDSSGANTFVVSVKSGSFSAADSAILKADDIGGGWGLHPQDIALVQGNILDVLDAEILTWQADH